MKKILLACLVAMGCFISALAQTYDYKLHKYVDDQTGGILTDVSPDGKWAVINLGTSATGITSCDSRLMNMETGKTQTVTFSNRILNFINVSSEDANGYVTIVGSFASRPYSYRFKPSDPSAAGTFKALPNKTDWARGVLTHVTPDGKYGVGYYTEYTKASGTGTDGDGESVELTGDYWFTTLFADLTTGTVIETPGLPTADRFGADQHAIKFMGITPDARYILGTREWYMPSEGFYFVYDTQNHTYEPIGFTKNGNKLTPNPIEDLGSVGYLDFPIMSPNGKYVAGSLFIGSDDVTAQAGYPFRYTIETGQLEYFINSESSNIEVGCIDNEGTIFGNPENGTPLRHFRIFYQDKFWIPFSQLCQQVYGFNFSQKTNFEFSGTATSVSGDGHRMVAFSDPQGESFAFDFGTTVEEACSKFDLLKNYTISPEEGAVMSIINTIDINFGRSVQVLGRGDTHLHLYKKGKNGAPDTKVRDGLSSIAGIQLKSGSNAVVSFSFRTSSLENGAEYYVLIDEGAIAPAGDASMVNKPIKITYYGRSNTAVQYTKITPAEGSDIDHFDANTSYVQITWDCPVKLTSSYSASLVRVEDGSLVAPLSIAVGNTEATKNQILVHPTSTVYLYNGVDYKIVIKEGSLSDYAGNEASYNKTLEISYLGSYVRQVSNDDTVFFDDFSNPNNSLNLWLLYEGDKNIPLASMQDYGFDQNNTPWNFSTHDTAEDPDYYATSHSKYAPSGTSDDWMMTVQLHIPEDGITDLYFDAQKMGDAENNLNVYIFEDEREFSYISEPVMNLIRQNYEVLAEITDLPAYGTKATDKWKNYHYSLEKWAGKDIYVIFHNKNYNKDLLLVDNVKVQREVLYSIGFNNDERVVGLDEIKLEGNFTVKTSDFKSGAISLVLKNSEGSEVSRREWPSISGTSIVNRPIPMKFDNPLPLTVGKENMFTIEVSFNGLDGNGNPFVRSDVYEGIIYDLSFLPTKRVVLEEMTGTTCPNCPTGHIAIERCLEQYKDQFIPVCIHSYDGDYLGAQFGGYSYFLGLNGAPSARINRIDGVYSPMYSTGSDVVYDNASQNLWYNVVAAELNKPALCDLNVNAMYNAKGEIDYYSEVRYALDASQRTSLFYVLLEDDIEDMQENNFAQSSYPGLGEWGLGGKYGDYYAWPVYHDDVVRAVIGDTFSGTLGIFPDKFNGGQTYTSDKFTLAVPAEVDNKNKLKLVAILIDVNTGQVVNAASTAVKAHVTAVDEISEATDAQDGKYIEDGRIYVKKNGKVYDLNGNVLK